MITKLLKTRLKRGYDWQEESDGKVIAMKENDGMYGGIRLDKVGQYSLLCFLIRVLRHRKTK